MRVAQEPRAGDRVADLDAGANGCQRPLERLATRLATPGDAQASERAVSRSGIPDALRQRMKTALVFAMVLTGCVGADQQDCTMDNPEYPDCLPDGDGGKEDGSTAARAQMNDLTIVM